MPESHCKYSLRLLTVVGSREGHKIPGGQGQEFLDIMLFRQGAPFLDQGLDLYHIIFPGTGGRE